MPVTFHAPPSWPTPPADFIPPAGWSPDPSWGEVPANWVFYTEGGMPVSAPPGAWTPPSTPVANPASSAPSAPPAQPSPLTPPPGTDGSRLPSPPPARAATPAPTHEPMASPGPVSGATPQPPSDPTGPSLPPPPTQAPDGSPLPGQPVEAFGAPGALPPQPPKKKSKVGLFIGLGVGALVILVAVAVFVGFSLFNRAADGPELTADQFNTLFAEGSTIMDRTIDYRTTDEPSASTSVHQCSIALSDSLRNGTDKVSAVTSDSEVYFIASLFADQDTTTDEFDLVDDQCDQNGSGVVNGARWLSVEFTDAHAVYLYYGNTVAFGAVNLDVDMEMSDLAAALQSEIAAAADS